MVEFVLDQTAVQFRAVDEVKALSTLALHAHFFDCSRRFPASSTSSSVAGVAAAGVGPKTSAVVLVLGALLQQTLARGC